MKIVDVSPRVTFPPVRGSSARTCNLLRHLSARHEVRQFSQARSRRAILRPTWITDSYCEFQHAGLLTGVIGERAERSWARAPLLSGAALHASRPALLDGWLDWADIAIVEFPWQFGYCRRRRPDAPVVLACHNVEAAKFESYAEVAGPGGTRGAWLALVRRLEAEAVAGADLVLAVSEADRRALIRKYEANAERVVVVANGADIRRYAPVNDATRAAAKRVLGLPSRPTILYAGADVPPNWAGLEWVHRVAAQAPQFTFLVVGSVSRPGVRGNVVATGLVEDFALCLAAADFSLCPIEHGGGTKIKLLESLAAGLPTVAFPQALNGLQLHDGEHVLVADNREQALLDAVMCLVEDADLSDRLSRGGRAFIETNHSWAALAEQLNTALESLAGGRPAVTDRRRTPPECGERVAAATSPGRDRLDGNG